MNEAGDALLEWDWYLGGNTSVEVMTRPRATDSWSPPVTLAEGARGDDLALDGAGHAFAVLEKGFVNPPTGSSPSIVQAAVKPASQQSWDDPVTLSSAEETYGGAIAVNSSGDAVVLLSRVPRCCSNSVLQAATWRSARGAWEAATDIPGTTDAGGNNVLFREIAGRDVAIDGAGNELALWARPNGSSSRDEVVEASFRPVGSGAWEPPVALGGPYPGGSAPAVGETRVAFDGAGNAVALWGTPGTVWGSYRPFGGSWQRPVDVGLGTVALNLGLRIGALNLSVAADSNALAVWGAGGHVDSAVRSAANGRWTAPSQLPGSENLTDPTGYLGGLALAADKAGNAVALWTAYDGSKDVVRAALRPADVARWTEPTDLGSSFLTSGLTVALDGHGDALASWTGWFGHSDVSELHAGGPILFTNIPSKAAACKPVRFGVTPAAWGAPLAGTPRWDFGDGSSAHGNQVRHAYPKPGTYTVAVAENDANGRDSTAGGTIHIRAINRRGCARRLDTYLSSR